jgi:hypothetical protein
VVWATDLHGRRDAVGASYSWTVDNRAPSMSNLRYTSTQTSITVTWVTSEPSITRLSWGSSAPSTPIAEDGVFRTSHSVTLSGLAPETVYLFNVGGQDPVGNSFVSKAYGISTLP